MTNLIVGFIISVGVLSFIKHIELADSVCYYAGDFKPDTPCFGPPWYFGLLGFAALLIILGVVQLIQAAMQKKR